MTYYTPPGDSVSPITNPDMQRPATHRPEDYDEDDGSDSLERVGALRFGTSREDYEHNHADTSSAWKLVGMCPTAPQHHLWRCITTHDCAGTMIAHCSGKECTVCHPPTT